MTLKKLILTKLELKLSNTLAPVVIILSSRTRSYSRDKVSLSEYLGKSPRKSRMTTRRKRRRNSKRKVLCWKLKTTFMWRT